ncbi:TatD family hydrolase [Hansschlegelia plantiphila]|uniref:LuxR family transcriptional regulator n=1 Tax=Hansschlegelia plantiphila TaxID=374655 RepID=A0A9W6MV83_9HYPH|nr:TatD family hydrolase [Hansschlegelia plantiphila]GLK67465.1 LuxR family transcriptional regulator [Hansschlegelia plantiphila]
MTALVDSHCHLDFPDFEAERDAVVARAHAAGVGLMVTISTRVRRFDQILGLVERYPSVFGTVGTHPQNAHEEVDVTTEELVTLAEHPKIVGFGEAGLDFHYPGDYAAQEHGFRAHIAAARETGLPLVIHARSADEAMIGILEDEAGKGAFPAVLHCFSSGAELARRGVALGLYVSFSGILTFKRSDDLRAIAAEVPEDRLLVETDAPYLAPEPFRGRRNEPAHTANTAAVLAKVRGWDEARTRDVTTDNFFRLFNKTDRNALVSYEGAIPA